jgi:hypothetical protein
MLSRPFSPRRLRAENVRDNRWMISTLFAAPEHTPLIAMPGAPARFPGFRRRLRALVAHSLDVPFDPKAKHQRLCIFGVYTRARIAFKAARFSRLRLPANSAPLRGALRAAFERAAVSRGPLCPTKSHKVHGFQTKTKGISHEQDR